MSQPISIYPTMPDPPSIIPALSNPNLSPPSEITTSLTSHPKSSAMGNQILWHLSKLSNANRRVHFYASSGGNAGLAAVCAARSLGYPCTVVVPLSTKPLMVQKLRDAGAADVIRYGENFAEAGEYMREVVMKNKTSNEINGHSNGEVEHGEDDDVVKIALHPFDHESIWEGNSTIVDELAYQLPPSDDPDNDDRALPVDAMICSVGGGGLLNGLIMGIERQSQMKPKKSSTTPSAHEESEKKKKDTIHLLATETTGTASLALAIAHRSLVSLPRITSQATSLGAVRVSARTLEYALAPPPGVAVDSVVLDDADAARGVLRLVDEERILVELACGVCVEAAVGDGAAAAAGKQGMTMRQKKRKRSVVADEGYGTGTETDVSSSSSTTSSSSSDAGSADAGDVQEQEQEQEQETLFRSKLRQLVPDLTPQSRVVIIVCGGSNVTIEMATEWRRELERGWGRCE